MQQGTPRGFRLHIGVFGRRNAGKSSLVNALTGQTVSLVSDQPGTTTDPVEKAMELQPFGPVLFIDTAGIDDEGELGRLRVERTHRVLARTDLALLVLAGEWGEPEEKLLTLLRERGVPLLVAVSQADRRCLADDDAAGVPAGIEWLVTDAVSGRGLQALKQALIRLAPAGGDPSSILGDLVPPGETAVLVVPIDKEAPKGRLILPQAQTIRDLLDHDALALVVKERELRRALENLRRPPALVVTDSQVILKVAADVPDSVPLTGFSVLFARLKGDLSLYAAGAVAIDRLRAGDRVLVAESCTHHPVGEDIARVKIPRWLGQYVGGPLDFHFVQGWDFPENLGSYRLVLHCGGCMLNRREVISRLAQCRSAGVPVSNYGLVIARCQGVFERILSPFPAAREAARQAEGRP